MSENINENMTEKEAKKAEELKKKELEREKYQEQLNDPNLTKKEKKKIKRKLEELEPFDLKKEIFSWIRIFIAAVVIAFLVNNFVIINVNVPSGSMETTIMTKDRMLGNRLAYKTGDIKRGDIVIFKFPDDESQLFVKRVIGLPGDKVVIKEGKIYINDSEEPLEEDYLPEEWTVGNDASNLPDGKNEYNVPEGSYFLMGDNRNISNDARYWNNTYVKKDKIIAKAMCVYFPFNHMHALESAEYN